MPLKIILIYSARTILPASGTVAKKPPVENIIENDYE
jgi:hypothetical protein